MTVIAALLDRNRAYAAAAARRDEPTQPFLPRRNLYLVTCLDPRTDPADFLGIEYGDAIVARTAGGRVTPAVIQNVAYMSYLVERTAPEGPYFEVAIIHHTDCGSGLLADESLRRAFAERSGYDEQMLADLPVTDPWQTVAIDVDRLRAAPQVSSRITVSGHVIDIATGLVTTVVDAAHPAPAGS